MSRWNKLNLFNMLLFMIVIFNFTYDNDQTSINISFGFFVLSGLIFIFCDNKCIVHRGIHPKFFKKRGRKFRTI